MQLHTVHTDSALGRWTLTLGQPDAPLAPFVDCFWDGVGSTEFARSKILPDGRCFLIFNLGGEHAVLPAEGAPRPYRRAWFSGLHDAHLQIESTTWSHLVGVRLQPEGAYRLLAAPMSDFACRVYESDEVFGAVLERLAERLAACAGAAGRLALLQAWLAVRLREARGWHPNVSHAMQRLFHGGGRVRVDALAGELGVSQKHLIHQFHAQVGMAPKRVARIVAFNRVLARLGGAAPKDWATIAQDAGYYDQPHFLREFRRFTGSTPREYLREKLPDELDVAVTQVNFFQDPAR